MHKKIISILILSFLLFPQIILAAQFDPNYLISDHEIQDATTMNREDVQAFLDEKGGYISTNKFEDKDNVIRDAADIIVRSATEHSINPKYILVKLQKEQSLVTSKNPTQKQLDWATGYAICDSCSMSDPKLQKNKGFGNQVDSAAAIIRWYYDNYQKETWIKRSNVAYTIDSTQVIPATLATAFLYTYTPHLLGNQNFWTLWQTWFDQVYPDGSLLKSVSDNTVYLIQNGQKRPFASLNVLISRNNPELIITVPITELQRYALGQSITLPNFSVVESNQTYYLLDYEKKRPFYSYQTIKDLGYYPDEIISVSEDDLASYKIGDLITSQSKNPNGQLVQIKGTTTQYYLKDTTYAPIFDNAIAKANFSNQKPEIVEPTELSEYQKTSPLLLNNGTLFGIEGENKIYVVENNKKRHIASEEVFNGLGYKWENIIWINTFAGMAHETGEPIYVKKTIPTEIVSVPEIKTSVIDTIQTVPTETTLNPVANLMQVTPASQTTYTGSKTYQTDIDAYIVADYDTGKIISGKNIDVVRPLASLTKVQSAYSALLHGLRLEKSTTYDSNIHKSEYHNYLIGDGDQVLNSDLLDAMLISSLNTPAHMLAWSTAGSEKEFILEVAHDLTDLDLTKTKILEPSGTNVNNVSTAKEYLTLFIAATKNKKIRDTLGKTSYSYSKVLNVSGIRNDHWSNHSNELALKDQERYRVIASKTGYLYESGANLAMLVERISDNKQFVIITLGNVDFTNRFVEPNNLSNWAMNQF